MYEGMGMLGSLGIIWVLGFKTLLLGSSRTVEV